MSNESPFLVRRFYDCNKMQSFLNEYSDHSEIVSITQCPMTQGNEDHPTDFEPTILVVLKYNPAL